MVSADLNRDGVLDERDIVAFMNGVRPSRDYAPLTRKIGRGASLRDVRGNTKPGR